MKKKEGYLYEILLYHLTSKHLKGNLTYTEQTGEGGG